MKGWGRHFIEGSVDTVADFEIAFEGFEVDVGGLFLDGLVEDEIDIADDRGGIGLGLGVFGVEVLGTGVELAEDIVHGPAFAAVAFVDLGFDEVVGSDDDDDFAAKGKAEILDGLGVEGIDEGEVEAFVIEVDGEGTVETGRPGGDEIEECFGRGPVFEVHE